MSTTLNPQNRLVGLGDARLRVSDRELLQDRTEWINDSLISFWLEWLSCKAYPDQPGLLLIGGAEAFAILHSGREAAPFFLEPRQYQQRQLVLLAVNNNSDVQAAGGGSHWSLLAFWRPADTFLHFDSSGGMNSATARQLYSVLRDPGSKYEEAAAPQQRNAYECGLVVLAMAELLCQRYVVRGEALSFSMSSADIDVDRLRQRMTDYIDAAAAAERQAARG